jgi:hypothetical protein
MIAATTVQVVEAEAADDANESLPSPYHGLDTELWPSVTQSVVDAFPLSRSQLFNLAVDAWKDVTSTRIGRRELRIGHDLEVPAQAIGYLFEKLFALALMEMAGPFRGGLSQATEKDIVHDDDPSFSFEIKTSTHKTGIYGNRSQSQRSAKRKKIRVGYHLVMNFTKPTAAQPYGSFVLRFGWLDNSDWKAQNAQSGQAAHVPPHIQAMKLVELGRWSDGCEIPEESGSSGNS